MGCYVSHYRFDMADNALQRFQIQAGYPIWGANHDIAGKEEETGIGQVEFGFFNSHSKRCSTTRVSARKKKEKKKKRGGTRTRKKKKKGLDQISMIWSGVKI